MREKNKEIPESVIQEPRKAEEMAYTETTYRTLAKNALKLGDRKLAEEFLQKGGEEAEEMGKKWEEEEERVKQEAEKITKEILRRLEKTLGEEQRGESVTAIRVDCGRDEKVITRLKMLCGVKEKPYEQDIGRNTKLVRYLTDIERVIYQLYESPEREAYNNFFVLPKEDWIAVINKWEERQKEGANERLEK